MRNIYQRAEIAKHYDRHRCFFKPEVLKNFFKEIISIYSQNNPQLKILDGGCGTGNIAFTICELLMTEKNKWQLVALDNSIPMLKIFSEKINKNIYLTELVRNNNLIFGFGDLNYRLPYANAEFDFVILSGVLHCLFDWKKTLNEIMRLLNTNGIIFFIYEADSLIKKICGNSVNLNEKNFADFWNYYWQLREEMKIFKDEVLKLVYDLSDPKIYLEEHSLKPIKEIVIDFPDYVSFSKFLELILKGSIYATGLNVKLSQRKFLYEKMLEWCRNEKINIEAKVPYTYQLCIDCFSLRKKYHGA